MKEFLKYWAIGIGITILIILLYFLGTVIDAQLSFLNPKIVKIVEFVFIFGLTSIFFGSVAWAIMGNKD